MGQHLDDLVSWATPPFSYAKFRLAKRRCGPRYYIWSTPCSSVTVPEEKKKETKEGVHATPLSYDWEECEEIKKVMLKRVRCSYRYGILFCICLVKVTLNFIFDIPAGLEYAIISIMEVEVSRYELLYSVYAWPAVLTSVVGGVLVDKYLGLSIGVLVFIIISTIGQLGFAFGAYFGMFWLMVVSRFMIGIGGEVALNCVDALAGRWFKGKRVGFVFGIIGTHARLGGAFSLYLNKVLYDCFSFMPSKRARLGTTLFVPFCMLVLCSLVTVVLVALDRYGQKKLRLRKKATAFVCRDMREFGLNYWLVVAILVTYFGTMFPFVSISQVYFVSKYGLSVNQANLAMVLTYVFPVFAPFFGLLIDRTGCNIYWGLTGMLLSLLAHLIFISSQPGVSYPPFIANTFIGMSYDFFHIPFWSAIALLVSDRVLGTSYGILSSMLSLGYAVIAIIAGLIIDYFGYLSLEIFFICFLSFGIVLTILLILLLSNSDNPVNKPKWKRKVRVSSREFESIKNSREPEIHVLTVVDSDSM